jgi:hypothetical protein
MAKVLIITLEFEDSSDLDFCRTNLMATIENFILEMEEKNHFDGDVTLDWDTED